MARNGSGTMSIQTAFANGQTADASIVLGDLEDIADEITNSIAADGQTPMSGVLRLISGSVGTPGLSFASDLDTGLYRSGSNSMGVTLGGTNYVSFEPSEQTIEGTASSFYTDLDTPVPNILRVKNRLFVGGMCDNDGSTDGAGGQTWIADETLGDFIERNATIGGVSDLGAAGVLGASRKSDGYEGVTVWAAGQSISGAGVERGYALKVYTSTGSGTTGATPPTHTVGTVSDGTVSWAFTRNVYYTPIGVSSVGHADCQDGRAAWANFSLASRESGAGTIYGEEMDVANFGSDITTQTPFLRFPTGSTIGYWIAAGYDSSIQASAHPSTCAILIGAGADSQTWNKGIVFDAAGLTGTDGVTGTATANGLARGHIIQWYGTGSTSLANINCTIDDTNNRVNLLFDDSTAATTGLAQFLRAGAVIASFEHGGGASASAEFIRILSKASGGAPEVRAGGASTDLDLLLAGKGTGVVSFGTHSAKGAEAFSGFITIKDAAGNSRKLMVCV